MDYIIIILAILNLTFALSFLLKRKMEESLILVNVSIILILFLSGIIYNFLLGYFIILFFEFCSFIFNIYILFKKRNYYKNYIFTVGLLMFLFYIIYFILLNKGRIPTIWDEFSHWALVAKNMYLFNDFGIGELSTTVAKTYLSGTTIFQYFTLKLINSYNESIIYFSFNILAISLILPIFKNFSSIKKPYFIFVAIVLLFLPTMYFDFIYTSLYVDGILGLSIAYSLYSYLLIKEKSVNEKYKYINFSFSLMLMFFIKEMGLLFSLIVFIIALVDQLFITNKFKFKNILKNTKIIILCYLPTIIIYLLWNFVLSKNLTASTNIGSPDMLRKLMSFVSLDFTAVQFQIADNYINNITNTKIFTILISLSFFQFLFVFLLLSINFFKKESNKTIKTLIIGCLSGAIIYSVVLLFSYMNIFNEYEGLINASYTRYISTYVLSMTLFLIYVYIYEYKENLKYILIIFCLFFISANTSILLQNTISSPKLKANANESMSQYNYISNEVLSYVKSSENIYVISIGDSGFDYWIFKYKLTPVKVTGAWSIGEKYYPDDIWTVNYSVQEWKKILEDSYDYVLLYKVNDLFIDKYLSLFNEKEENIKQYQLYKVKKGSENREILELVGEY